SDTVIYLSKGMPMIVFATFVPRKKQNICMSRLMLEWHNVDWHSMKRRQRLSIAKMTIEEEATRMKSLISWASPSGLEGPKIVMANSLLTSVPPSARKLSQKSGEKSEAGNYTLDLIKP